MNESSVINPEAFFEFISLIFNLSAIALFVMLAMFFLSPSIERAFDKFERWCGRGQ